MTATEHADFEALSAYVDGEAPEWADHVAGCPRCRAAAADVRALSAAVAASADPPAAAQREAAITAALEADTVVAGAGAPAAAGPAAERGRFARRREPGRLRRPRAEPGRLRRPRAEPGRLPRPQGQPRPWAMPAVAAVVVGLLGLSGFVLSANRSTNENTTTVAGPAFDAKAESAVPGGPAAPVGDLGDVPDAAALRARALGVAPTSAGAATAAAGRATSSPNPVAASDPGALGATNPGSTGGTATAIPPPVGGTVVSGSAGGAASLAPNAVGTRPCEERARAREPGLGPVTYFATARRGNVPAYVLGFASGPTVTLLMLAQDGCAELLRSAGP